ncbi:MAG: hypothetical protein KAJ03_06490, partial [Gammaproteobacteria bacterium]|nr:hypothetical protein [Gammaproteobacteria bacterium]
STLAMYTGQHNFSSGANVDCGKCHGGGVSDSIAQELNNSDNHTDFECKRCHGFSTGTDPTPNTLNNGSMGHAATTQVNCVGCHAENGLLGTNITDADDINVTTELNNGAHKAYKDSPPGDDLDKACISCHTKVGVEGNIGGTNYTNISIAGFNYSGTS